MAVLNLLKKHTELSTTQILYAKINNILYKLTILGLVVLSLSLQNKVKSKDLTIRKTNALIDTLIDTCANPTIRR
jgi:hypothetical protein